VKHAVTIPYPVFAQALEAGSLKRIENIAREMPRVTLRDSLRIVELMARDGDDRYERAAARWLDRLRAESDLNPGDVHAAAAWLHELPQRADAIEPLRALLPMS